MMMSSILFPVFGHIMGHYVVPFKILNIFLFYLLFLYGKAEALKQPIQILSFNCW